MRAALLARVSSDEQGEADRASLPAQLSEMRARCEREGWEVVREFVASGESAKPHDLRKRPVLLEAVHAAERGEFEVLMVHESSRFARNVELSTQVRRRLREAGVTLVDDVRESVELHSAEKGFRSVLKDGLNEYFSEKISEHTRKVKLEHARSGLHVGFVPFGYRGEMRELSPGMVRRVCVPVEEEAEAVRQAFREYVAGASYTEIAARWTAAGLRPRSLRGYTAFSVPAMQTILENDFYCGYVRHLGQRYPGQHEPLVSEELWQKAQLRVRRKESPAWSRRALSGVATCAACAGPLWLTAKGKRGYKIFYYREPSSDRRRECANARTLMRADAAEAEVGRVFRAMSLPGRWFEDVWRAARKMPVKGKAERARLEGELARLNDVYISGGMERGEWERRKGALESRLAELPDRKLVGELALAGQRLASVGELWEVMTVEERREACRTVFESVSVDTREKRVRVRPWGEFAPYFEKRRREVVGPDMGLAGSGALEGPTDGFYEAWELEVAA